jgi:hypothetical protein
LIEQTFKVSQLRLAIDCQFKNEDHFVPPDDASGGTECRAVNTAWENEMQDRTIISPMEGRSYEIELDQQISVMEIFHGELIGSR